MDIGHFPWLYPPEGAKPIDKNKAVTLAAATSDVLLETIRGLQGYKGVLRYTDLYSANFGTAAVPRSYFTLKRDNQPIAEYVRILMPMVPEIKVLIFIEENQVVTLHGTNLIGTDIPARYRLAGWYWRTTP